MFPNQDAGKNLKFLIVSIGIILTFKVVKVRIIPKETINWSIFRLYLLFPPSSSIFVLYFSNEKSVHNISMVFSRFVTTNIDDVRGKRTNVQNILQW